jgi:hypothetical protein
VFFSSRFFSASSRFFISCGGEAEPTITGGCKPHVEPGLTTYTVGMVDKTEAIPASSRSSDRTCVNEKRVYMSGLRISNIRL